MSGKTKLGANRQAEAAVSKLPSRIGDLDQGWVYLGGEALTLSGQYDIVPPALEQLQTQMKLQHPDLSTDCRLRQVQLPSRSRETAESAGRLECSKATQRWQAVAQIRYSHL